VAIAQETTELSRETVQSESNSSFISDDSIDSYRPSIHAEAQFDFRARMPSIGKFSSLLYSSMVSLGTTNGFGQDKLGFNVLGLNQYGSFRWQQATVEAELGNGGNPHILPQHIQAGLIRLPFGIYDYRETYSSGLIQYPLPRSDYAYDAVDWGVPGVQWTGGISKLQVEAAGVKGKGVGLWGNENNLDGGVIRLQTYAPPNLVLGFSGWQGHQAEYPGAPLSEVNLFGVDWRYTQPYLLLRGEALGGILADDHTKGAYLDVYYRLPHRERFTLVARGEFLKPATDQPTARQLTLGGRWNIDADWMLAVNWRRNNADSAYSFTWNTPSGPRGELLFQLLRRFTIL
jgi:hypothetical protein